ncbi:MAG: helix-turn-helix transcriptional regulator [Chthoniobacterales bacterium]
MRHRNVIGSQIRRLRSQRGWSQEQLTAKLQIEGLDISRSSVAKIENGQQAVFDFEVLFFCRVFRVLDQELHPLVDPRAPDFRKKISGLIELERPAKAHKRLNRAESAGREDCSRDEQCRFDFEVSLDP